MYKKLCFNWDVIEKKDVVVGMKVGESVKRMLDRIADEQDRTISYVARELMIRGLALYHLDGNLKDDMSVPARRLAPVVATITPAVDPKDEVRQMVNAGTQRVPVMKQKAK